jgi:hypothetical protein
MEDQGAAHCAASDELVSGAAVHRPRLEHLQRGSSVEVTGRYDPRVVRSALPRPYPSWRQLVAANGVTTSTREGAVGASVPAGGGVPPAFTMSVMWRSFGVRASPGRLGPRARTGARGQTGHFGGWRGNTSMEHVRKLRVSWRLCCNSEQVSKHRGTGKLSRLPVQVTGREGRRPAPSGAGERSDRPNTAILWGRASGCSSDGGDALASQNLTRHISSGERVEPGEGRGICVASATD